MVTLHVFPQTVDRIRKRGILKSQITSLTGKRPRMILNWIWIGFFLAAFFIGLYRMVVLKDMTVISSTMESAFSMAKIGFEISLGLTGVITWAEIQLKPISSPFWDLETIKFKSLEEFLIELQGLLKKEE